MHQEFFARDDAEKAADLVRLVHLYTGIKPTEHEIVAESNFKAEAQDFGIHLRAKAGKAGTDYIQVCNHVDDLLDQVVQCLDRCLGDKAIYDVLRLEQLRLALELYEAQELEAISVYQQKQSAFWKAGEIQADLEAEARQALLTTFAANGTLTGKLSAQLDAVAAFSYSQEGSEYFKNQPGERPWIHNRLQDQASADQARSNERANEKLAELARSRGEQARISRESDERKATLRRDLLAYRADETTRKGSILHYKERITHLIDRASRDYREAIEKALAVYVGVTQVLGRPCLKVDEAQWERPLDGLIEWARSAKEQLNKIRLHEQRTVHRVPLSTIVDLDRLWKNQRCDFEMSNRGRLAGIAAVLPAANAGYAALCVTIPEQRIGEFGILSALPVHLGRVVSQSTASGADIYGLPLVRNRSLQGTWTVEIVDGNRPAKGSDDIYLDLVIQQ